MLTPLVLIPFFFCLAFAAYLGLSGQIGVAALFAATVLLPLAINILVIRKMVIAPIRSIEAAARKVAQGDLSFRTEGESTDEIGRAGMLLRESFLTLEGVLQRIKELSDRILVVVEEVEQVSEKVLKGAETEAEAIDSISSSVGELNETAAEIADNTEGLASSAEGASAAIEQMVSSIRNINDSIQQLDGVAESTSTSIGQLRGRTKEVAAESEELAAASEGTLAAISEITETIKEVEAHARESAMLSEKATSDAANLGMASIAKTTEGMKEIASSVQNTAECIRVLGNRSQEIEKILSVIQGVNDDTNLLSLNAAILASKAGEHGRGFSVVAAEMRDLSERTGNSTKEIASLIQAVQTEVGNAQDAMQKGINAVEGGLRLAKEAEEALKKVMQSSEKSSEMTLSIKRATGEQALAAGLVADATERVREMIGRVAKAAAEQSEGVLLIKEAAERMKTLSHQVSKATGEQAMSSGLIAQTTELFSERSRQISSSLGEHRKGSLSILSSIEAVKGIPVENRKLAFRISNTLWNLQKDAELLRAEMERFKFSGERGHSLRLGVVPLQEPSIMFRKFTPLSEYLARKLGRKVDLKVALDMESAVKDLGENVTQLCAMGPANYVEAHSKYGVKVIVKALRQGKPFHRAAIVVRTGSPAHSVRDLKGKNFAFVSPKSATGHVMPLVALKEGGIIVDDLMFYQFLGSHDEVAGAVLAGDFDAGGLMEETAHAYREKGLRVLQLSPEIPEFNVSCNNSVDVNTMGAIRDALISLDVSKNDEAMVLRSLGKDCTGFVPASDAEYDVFREKIIGIKAEVEAEFHGQRMKSSRAGRGATRA